MSRTDARIRYTQSVLKQTLLSFLQEKPINKITVKEVCERAELNRATFYAHYSDCFALLESKLVDSFDVTALIEAIYTMIEQQQEACRVLIFQNACPNVLRRMIGMAHDESISYWKRRLHHITEAELEMLYTHLSNGLMHVVVEVYEKYSREEVVRFVNRIVQCSLSQFQ